MKLALNIIGGLAVLMGVIWILQGTNVVAGVPVISHSFMMGKMAWVGWGAWLVAFAAGLLVWNNRTKKQG
jgi:hypothetical protein